MGDFDYDCRADTAFRERDRWAYYNIPVLGDNALIAWRAPATLPCARLARPSEDRGVFFAPESRSESRDRARTASSSVRRPRARSRRR